MRKIASPQDFIQQLDRIRQYGASQQPRRRRLAAMLNDLARQVEPYGVRTVTAAMSESEFWAITEPFGWGTKTTDFKPIKKALMARFSQAEAEELSLTFQTLKHKLMKVINRYERTTGDNVEVSDDGFDDLTSHIIGLGRAEYEANLKNPELAANRARKRQYKESFAYCFPSEYDYTSLNVSKYVKWAQRIIDTYSTVLSAGDFDIPWLPRMANDLKAVISMMRSFVQTQDVHAMLAHEAVARDAAENISKLLGRLNPDRMGGDPTREADLSGAIGTAQNEWLVKNFFTDLRDYLT